MAKTLYSIPMVPGPTSVPEKTLSAFGTNFGSCELEKDFFRLCSTVQQQLQTILDTNDHMPVLQFGAGTLGLWSATKSTLVRGDRVLCIVNGIYGQKLAEMARSIGCDVKIVNFDISEGCDEIAKIQRAAQEHRPKLITVVHCETPTGLLNNIAPLGQLAKDVDALLLVDCISSAFGCELKLREWNIDIACMTTHTTLSAPPSLAIMMVNERAWRAAEQVAYEGYDALLPWRQAINKKDLPYTFTWHALAALHVSLTTLLSRGLQDIQKEHRKVGMLCRERLREMGVKLIPKKEEHCSPTVSAAWLPEGWSFEELDAALREKGMVVGKSEGDLATKAFCIGHMGSQASTELITKGMNILQGVLQTKR